MTLSREQNSQEWGFTWHFRKLKNGAYTFLFLRYFPLNLSLPHYIEFQELEEVYVDLCNTLSESILLGSEIVSTRVSI